MRSTMNAEMTSALEAAGAFQTLPQSTRIEQDRRTLMTPAAVFRYDVAPEHAGYATLTIRDNSGREIRTLLGEPRAAGSYEVAWDRTDRAGTYVPVGVYYYELEVGAWRSGRKVVVVM